MPAATSIVAVSLLAYGLYESNQADVHQKRAQRAQARSQEIATAEGKVKDIRERKQRIRQERVRKAQILASAQTQGISGGSAESGAIAATTSLTAGANAAARGSQLTAEGISRFNQIATTETGEANKSAGRASLAFQGAGTAAGMGK